MCIGFSAYIIYHTKYNMRLWYRRKSLWISGGGRKMIKEGIMDDISIDGSIALPH